mgnify:CR=1 FL=1
MHKNKDVKTSLSYIFLFFVIAFFLVTIGFITLQGNNELNLAKHSEHWPATEGVIVKSEMDSYLVRRSRKGFTKVPLYVANITYSYKVDGELLETYSVSIGKPQVESRTKADVQLVLDKYPLGKEVQVYYDPNNPETAVLEPGVSSQNYDQLTTAFCSGFVILGVLGLFWFPIQEAKRQSALRSKRKGKRKR